MIRTAMPFGYLFIALFLLAAFVAGISIFVLGWRRRSRIAKLFGCGMVCTVVALIVANLWFESALEWNPTIGNDAEVVGIWADHTQKITLGADKTFTYGTSSQLINGTWTRDGWNLYLRGVNYSAAMRFVQFRGSYRLMTHPVDDPDMWDGDLGLRQTHPATVAPIVLKSTASTARRP